MQKLLELYRQWTGTEARDIRKLAGAGSNREYYRLTCAEEDRSNGNATTVIGVVGTSREENHAFVHIARHFAKQGLAVPRVLAVSTDEMRYLQTDLGEQSLFDAIAAGRNADGQYGEEEQALLRKAMRALPEIQIRGAEGLDFSLCYPQPEFNEANVMFDLNYFKYCFLKALPLDFHEMRLEEDFRTLASDLTADSGSAFMYRDFQARNVMLDADRNLHFIDFQGGRRGPYYYDVASFLWQASAKYPQSLRNELASEYYNTLKTLTAVPSRSIFDSRLKLFVLFRTLQVLGAYGFRGYFERKQHFVRSIPPAIDNLRCLLAADACPYPYLADILTRLAALPQLKEAQTNGQIASPDITSTTPSAANDAARKLPEDMPSVSKYDNQGALVVKIFSFSYKKGIPNDDSGNGGGYVFDCRSTHNPGRYEQYKPLTGLDEPVIRFLEDDGEILTFLDNIYKLADAHVQRYMERGFTSLMFCFGCTGGRHRSVYCAQHLAEHISNKFGVEVRLFHREQDINQTFKAR